MNPHITNALIQARPEEPHRSPRRALAPTETRLTHRAPITRHAITLRPAFEPTTPETR